MHDFDSKDLKRLFGIPASQIRALIRAGHIHPLKKAGRLSYSFQDLIVLRTAGSLRAAKIPAQRINRTLREIRDSLPGEMPLSGLSITAIGDRIVVREGRALRESDSGQYTLALEVSEQGGDLVVIDKGNPNAADAERGTQHAGADSPPVPVAGVADFEAALALEGTDPKTARKLYENCLARDGEHLEARINLGRLLHLEGRLRDAEKVYRGADAKDALLSFNLAVLLEDLERESEAVLVYRDALALDPGFADAHFNLARLYERREHPAGAARRLRRAGCRALRRQLPRAPGEPGTRGARAARARRAVPGARRRHLARARADSRGRARCRRVAHPPPRRGRARPPVRRTRPRDALAGRGGLPLPAGRGLPAAGSTWPVRARPRGRGAPCGHDAERGGLPRVPASQRRAARSSSTRPTCPAYAALLDPLGIKPERVEGLLVYRL